MLVWVYSKDSDSKIRYKDVVRLQKQNERKMKKLSDNILTGFEGLKETWKALDNVKAKRTRLELYLKIFLSEHMVQTIIFRQYINDGKA